MDVNYCGPLPGWEPCKDGVDWMVFGTGSTEPGGGGAGGGGGGVAMGALVLSTMVTVFVPGGEATGSSEASAG